MCIRDRRTRESSRAAIAARERRNVTLVLYSSGEDPRYTPRHDVPRTLARAGPAAPDRPRGPGRRPGDDRTGGRVPALGVGGGTRAGRPRPRGGLSLIH